MNTYGIKTLDEILEAFHFNGEFTGMRRIESGHINNTFVLEFTTADGDFKEYLLQKINTYVFKNPDQLMENIVGVTEHLRKKITENGGDPDRESLHVYFAKNGAPYFVDSDNNCWRCLNYIYDSYSLQNVESATDFYNAAKAFGKFQGLLADYPIDSLHETIPNFHNTVSRIADFKKAVKDDLAGRVNTAEKEAAFILEREADCSVLVNLINEGKLPVKVTHNDTKLNNVMFDSSTNEGICVVDLDTVMPGLSLYDFGDSIRFGANTASEDEKDLSKVSLSLEYFEAYTRGFLQCAGHSLCDEEIRQLPFSAKLMTLECGMRFLGDYFNGNLYFRVEYEEHNLVRARTQLALVADMEKKFDLMQEIVEKCRKELGL